MPPPTALRGPSYTVELHLPIPGGSCRDSEYIPTGWRKIGRRIVEWIDSLIELVVLPTVLLLCSFKNIDIDERKGKRIRMTMRMR